MNSHSFLCFVILVFHCTRAEDYPTCTVPDTTIINQLRDRIATIEERNRNNSEALLRLEDFQTRLNEIEALLDQTTFTLETVQRLEDRIEIISETQNAALARERALHDPNWFTPFNNFQYRLTPFQQNWTASRRACQELGGDIAAEGIQNNDVRRRIAVTLSLENTWIGLSDIETEGQWLWIDGTISTDENTEWFRGEPSNNQGNQHCGEIWGKDFSYTLNDDFCDKDQFALCERRLIVAD